MAVEQVGARQVAAGQELPEAQPVLDQAAVPGPGPSTSGTAGSTSVAPFNAQNSAINPATGQPYDPSNINDPNNPSNPLNANQSK